MYTSPEFAGTDEEAKKNSIGEFIYDQINASVGEEMAPKITGMIIDLPLNDLVSVIRDYPQLQQKVSEGMNLLSRQ